MQPRPFSFWKKYGEIIAAEASDWQTRVTAAGGNNSNATLTAVSAFVDACKSAGLWAKINRVNLFCGSNLAACLVPLKVGGGRATEFNYNFVEGDYSESTGLTGNGTTKTLLTGLSPALALIENSTHFGIYSTSSVPAVSADGVEVSNTTARFKLHAPYSDGNVYADFYNDSTGRITAAIGSGPFGFILDSRTSSTSHAVYKNGTLLAQNSTSGGALPNREMHIFGALTDAGLQAASPYTRVGYTVGDGLNSTEAAAYSAAWEEFQDALGRGVA